ncbi:MAG TPA: hypothetical protein VN814_14490 [Caulobacteraceae bacterium]|nr:hypothetical protein [Caulobacteraceae bacterium]
MTYQPEKPTGAGRPAAPRRSPFRLLAPIALGLVVGSALYGGYEYWSHHKSQQALADAPGDADMAKPTADECAIARAALHAIHVTGADKAWQSGAGVSEMSLGAYSKVINPADVSGYSDDEADNLRSKSAADWRWCPGMAAFVGGLGWRPMGGDDVIAALALGRPGLNKAGDEARAYEAFLAPRTDSGVLKLTRGPWLVTLHKGANGAWQVTSTDDLKRANP